MLNINFFSKNLISILLIGLFVSLNGFSQNNPSKITTTQKSKQVKIQKTMQDIAAPDCKMIPKELTTHGDKRVDNYYWLNERENPEVIAYLEAENAYKDAALKHIAPLKDRLYDEIIGRIKQDDASVPYFNNGYFYANRYETGKEYPIYTRKKGKLEAAEQILLNVNNLAEGFDYYAVGGMAVSPNNKVMAYGIDTVGRRQYTILFKNLETGEMLKDVLPNTTGRAVWASDNKTVFYTTKDETLRSSKIWRHTFGTDNSQDVEVYEEKETTYGCYVTKTKSNKYLVIGSYATLASEMRILPADNPTGEFEIFEARPTEKGGKHEYWIDHYDDKWFIMTNLDAQNFRLMETAENAIAKSNWKEIIPHRKDVLIEDMEIFKNYLVLSERKNGLTQLRVIPSEGEEHYIDFGEDVFMAYTSVNKEFDTDILRIGYTSLTTPNSTYDYNMKTREMTLLKQQEIPGGTFSPDNYQAERVYVTARDGVKVPVSIVYRKGVKLDGTAPCMIYGYGSYGSSMDPYFNSIRLSLLDRGFVYAIAHVRGGQEMGRHWYEDGKLLNKKNTFTDFVDCSAWLIDNKYSAKDKLFASGRSAGGLLMGAIINMRPDLYKGILAGVPFVDVVTTMLDESIPLTTGEFDEWGNPKEEEYYNYIKSYSPYDNVVAQDYPAMLVSTGLHDSQVQYWEPAKWVAKLRDLKTDDNLLILDTTMEAGHGGKSGRFVRQMQYAREYAFLLDLIGITE